MGDEIQPPRPLPPRLRPIPIQSVIDGTFTATKVTAQFKDYGTTVTTWSRAFITYVKVMMHFFGAKHPSLHFEMVTFWEKIEDLAQLYNWATAILRPNVSPDFPVFNPSSPPLRNSPSPFVPCAWQRILHDYPGPLPSLLAGILEFEILVGYCRSEATIESQNLTTAMLDEAAMSQKLESDLALGRVEVAVRRDPFISSPLGFVTKASGGFRRIHHLSHPYAQSVNANIDKAVGHLVYMTVREILDLVIIAGRGSVIMKRDMRDAFRNIPVALENRWLLGFHWQGASYQE